METQTTREVKSTLNNANKKAQALVDKADEAVSSFSLNDLRETIEQALESVRSNGRVAVDRTESWIKANPYKALMGAVTVGAVIAGLMRKRK